MAEFPRPVTDSDGDWLDWERALAVVDDDVGLLEHLVDVFIRQFAPAVAELHSQAAHGDWAGIARRAHQLAGAAGAIGAHSIEVEARAVDRTARAALAPGAAVEELAAARAAAGHLAGRLAWTLECARTWRGHLPGA